MKSRNFRETMYNNIVGAGTEESAPNVVSSIIDTFEDAVEDVLEEIFPAKKETKTYTEKENLNMADNSSLNATEIAVGSLLAGNRGGGYGGGGGAWGGGYGGVAPFAGPASNAVRINRNEGTIRDQGECTRDAIGAGLDRVSAQNLEGRANDRIAGVLKAVSDSEFRSLDRQRDIERVIAQNAKEAAECCCAVKVKAAEDKAELLAAIAAQGAATITRELNAANAKITQLETINALSNGGHGH